MSIQHKNCQGKRKVYVIDKVNNLLFSLLRNASGMNNKKADLLPVVKIMLMVK